MNLFRQSDGTSVSTGSEHGLSKVHYSLHNVSPLLPREESLGRARVWLTGETRYEHEEENALLPLFPKTGVCFSGGGTRALTAAYGQLRALTHLGLMGDIGYLSCVSGGSWAAVPYTYHELGAQGDEELLGPVSAPEEIDMQNLAEIPDVRLARPATTNFRQVLESCVADDGLARERVWIHAVAKTFLAPFGLFDPARPSWFTWDSRTEADILAVNPVLTKFPAHKVRADVWRPFLLINTCLMWPPGPESGCQRVGFECTPLYVGSPNRLTLESRSNEFCIVGGGYLEAFAFGCPKPIGCPDNHGRMRIVMPTHPFSLADAVGMSSAVSNRPEGAAFVPQARYWPPGSEEIPSTEFQMFADGGEIENFGLIGLLRRRVERLIVFVNTLHPLSERMEFREPFETIGIDPFIPPLFGYPSSKCPHNQVFSRAAFQDVVSKLHAAKRRGHGVIASTRLMVQKNERWGVSGDWETQVCWIYNERVPSWEILLNPEIRRAIEDGQLPHPSGPVENFPFYKTEGQNPGSIIRLTPMQVNLLAELSCWNVLQHGDYLSGFLRGT